MRLVKGRREILKSRRLRYFYDYIDVLVDGLSPCTRPSFPDSRIEIIMVVSIVALGFVQSKLLGFKRPDSLRLVWV